MKLGAYAIEQDYSHYVANATEIVLAVVGTATRGPINEPTVCTSLSDLVNKFGNLSPSCLGTYAAQYFINQASKLYYVRAASASATESTVTIAGKKDENTDASALTLKAKTKGTGYDDYSVSISNLSASAPYTFDLTIMNKASIILEVKKGVTLNSLRHTVDDVLTPIANGLNSDYVTVSGITDADHPTVGRYTFSGGDDGIESITASDYITAGQALASDNYDMNILSVPGVSDAAVIVSMLSMCETRGDVLYLVDPPNTSDRDDVVAWHNGEEDYEHAKFNSSYGALYWSWQRIYDSVNKLYVEVPPSVVVAPVIARSAQVSELWYAPAGLNRGKVTGVLESVVAPDTNSVDYMYSGDNSVNCIITDKQIGLCVFGQKTLSRLDTALNRVNVRMLMNYLKRIIVAACRTLTFEPNDRVTWNLFEDRIEPTLKNIKNHRGMYEYRIVKGEEIVTNEDIDNYRMPCMILIRPTKAAEEIPIYFTITSTGADFNDVLEANGIVSGN